MKKREFLQIIAQATFPGPVKVKSFYGGCYKVCRIHDDGLVCYMWVDELGGGRVSIKFKYFPASYAFMTYEDRLRTFINTASQNVFFTDAATEVDTFFSKAWNKGWVLRLRCDKQW